MTVVSQSTAGDIPSATRAVTLRGVVKSFRSARGTIDALSDVELSVNRGEFVEVRGHSGAGKSTLLALVGGLAQPSRGEVFVFGEPIHQWSAARRAAFRRDHVGFVFQLFHLLPYLNVCENVLLAATAVTPASRQRALALLEELGLSDRLTHRPAQLSAGERQRVALARALLNDPRLLLADEPTGNLDAENAAIVMGRLERFQAEGGTVLLVTHDDRAAQAGRRVIRLVKGRVVEADPGASVASESVERETD